MKLHCFMTHFRCLSVILDDVVLEYLAGLLSNLKEAEGDTEEESFDGFIDVLTGYIPEFSQFDRFKLHAYDNTTQHSSSSLSSSQSVGNSSCKNYILICLQNETD